jgi:hypothetical protein
MSPSVEFSSGMGEFAETFTSGLQRYGPGVGNLVGTPAALFGLTAIVWHLSAGAAILGWLAFVVASLWIDVLVRRDYAKQQQAKRSSPPSDDTAQH